MFQDSVVRKIFGPKREQEGEKLQNDRVHNMYSLPNVIIKSRMVKWVGHVECIYEIIISEKLQLKALKARDHLEDLGVDVRILTLFIGRYVDWEGVDWIHLA
jgi:hypothetical protein